MLLKSIFTLTISCTIFMSCEQINKSGTIGDYNPLLANYETPFQAPPFEEIKNGHFKPAILEAIKIQQNEIDVIANNKEKPTFENTIVAFEESGALLNRITTTF